MPEYLSKEEIRQWRSSLERITLEEFAARLGKIVQGEKQTNDMVDKVMSKSLSTLSSEPYPVKNEKIQTIALKSFEKEKEIMSRKSEQKPVEKAKKVVEVQAPKQTIAALPIEKKIVESKPVVQAQIQNKEFNFTFKKNLTSREQTIFDYFLSNRNTIVYAKDLAKLLDLPRDYVYKYIKNLRSKMTEDVLFNADNGGYVLKA